VVEAYKYRPRTRKCDRLLVHLLKRLQKILAKGDKGAHGVLGGGGCLGGKEDCRLRARLGLSFLARSNVFSDDVVHDRRRRMEAVQEARYSTNAERYAPAVRDVARKTGQTGVPV
jgi:hypothetical protein